MFVIGAFLPLLLMILIIVLIARSANSGSKKYFQGRKLKMILLTYLLILLLSAAIYPFIQIQMIDDEGNRGFDDVIAIQDKYFESISQEKKPSFEGMEVRDENEWDFHEDTLYLSTNHTEFFGSIIIEKVDSLKGKIKAVNYVSPSIVDGIEFTSAMPSLSMKLTNNILSFGLPLEQHEVRLALLKKEFTIAQFTDEGSLFSSHSYSVLGDP